MSNSQIIIYQTESGETKIDVRLENETVWLTQKTMAELFHTSPQNITIHLKNIFEEGELQEDATCKDFLQVQKEGNKEVKRNIEYYNLVEQYLVFATGQAMRRIPMYMSDWIEKLHGFLSLNDRAILQDAGRISHEIPTSQGTPSANDHWGFHVTNKKSSLQPAH